MSTAEDSLSAAEAERLIQHARRPQWGIGVLVEDEGDRRHYQFQDGRLRIFKEGWFNLLEPVDRPLDEMEEVISELERKLDRSLARAKILQRRRDGDLSAIRFVDQLRVFRSFHPEGFEDASYVEAWRTREGGKLRKSHIDRALGVAAKRLERAHIPTMTAAELQAACVAAMKATDLVSPSADVRPFAGIPPEHIGPVARALEALLMLDKDVDDDTLQRHFDMWTQALFDAGVKPGWSLTTTLPALVHPQWHVSVKSSVFRLQAKWMAPGRSWDNTPSGALYVRMVRMAREIRQRLDEEGHKAADNFDITRFVWLTLRPKGKARLKQLIDGDEE